ncbi:unnamed protein product [Echinostoma caproni]|uniref:SOSS complex subunit A homolog n=1 Tax=Echinostoma caproni TaxID=27848 RepID=A0A183AJR9_9TREM|nr:unnamed protein product [Echinostoma caproni]
MLSNELGYNRARDIVKERFGQPFHVARTRIDGAWVEARKTRHEAESFLSKLNDEKMVIYRNFCASQENPSLQKSLLKDMQLLADDNRRLFVYLLPDVFTVFSSELTNDPEFMRLIVGTLDPIMLNTLICEIVRGHLNLFRSNDLSPVLTSLQWDSIEQLFFWQLINAHEIPTRRFLPLVRCVDPSKHPEACTNLIQLFKLEKPNYELVRALLSRPKPDDPLSVTALHFWSCPDNHSSLFAEILSEMITVPLSFRSDSASGSTRENRDRRRNGVKNQITPENAVDLSLILTHLDSIRRNCKNMSTEDQPSPPSMSVGGNTRSAGAQSSGVGYRLNGAPGSNTETNTRRGGATGRGAAFGSKGGHSLHNDDPGSAESGTISKSIAAQKKRRSRNSSPVRGGGNTAKTGKRTASDNKERRSMTGGKRGPARAEQESSPKEIVVLDDSLNDEEEDDDDEDKSLEVVVIEEDSGDEQNNDRIRPSKRRKTANRRFNLDD